MGDWLTGMVQGFTARHREVEERNYAESLRSRQREGAVLQSLAASPDPEVRSLAIAGILDAASPARRAKGLRGWVGELEQSPYLHAIRGLSPTVTKTQTLPDVPTAQGYIPQVPPAQGAAALPAQSPVQPGPDGAPLSPVQPLDAPGTVTARGEPHSPITPDARTALGQTPPGTLTLQTEQPRSWFPTAAEQARELAGAKAAGDVEGEVQGLVAAGFAESEARELVKQTYLRRVSGSGGGGLPFQAVAGETQANGQWVPVYGTYDKTTGGWKDPSGRPLLTFRRATTPMDLGDATEAAALRLFGRRAAQLTPEELQAVQQEVDLRTQETARLRTLGGGIGKLESPATPAQAMAAGIPVGTPGTAVAGQAIPTAANRETRRTLTAVQQELQTRVLPLLSVLPSQRDLGGTVAPGAVLAARRRINPTVQTQVAQLDSAINAIKTTLGRARGDTRLSDADIQRIDAALASLEFSWDNLLGGDSRETATARIQETLTNLQIVLQSLPPEAVPDLSPTIGAPPPPAPAAEGRPGTQPTGRKATGAPGGGAPGGAGPAAAGVGAARVGAAPPSGSPLDQPAVSATGGRWVIRNGQLVQEP